MIIVELLQFERKLQLNDFVFARSTCLVLTVHSIMADFIICKFCLHNTYKKLKRNGIWQKPNEWTIYNRMNNVKVAYCVHHSRNKTSFFKWSFQLISAYRIIIEECGDTIFTNTQGYPRTQCYAYRILIFRYRSYRHRHVSVIQSHIKHIYYYIAARKA